MIVRDLEFACTYYLKHGIATGEVDIIRHALAAAKQLDGRTPTSEFLPNPWIKFANR